MKQENIKIKKLKFYCHQFDFPKFVYSMTFGNVNNGIVEICLECYDVIQILNIQENDYLEFCKNISSLTKDWKHRYKADSDILDGQEWLLSILFDNNKRTYYKGDITEPDNFEQVKNYIKNFYENVTMV